MYTTSQVAERLQLTSKKVLYFSKKGNLKLEKSSTGSYLFTEDQLEKIKEISDSTIQNTELKQVETENNELNQVKTVNTEYLQQINEISIKISNLEQEVETKANEVVSVQILEHRNEIEDLKKIVKTLELQVSKLTETVDFLKTELEDQKKIVSFKPKKRFAILSIFGG